MSNEPETTSAGGPRAAAGSAALPGARAFCVAWAYRDGRDSGNGSPMPEAEARAWAEAMNDKYPEISHRAVPVT